MCNSDGMNELIGKIHLGDCMEVLRGLPDKCVDLLLTDPPYGTGGDYDTALRYGGRWGKYKDGTALSRANGRDLGDKVQKKIHDWDTAPSAEVFAELFRVSREQIIWGGNYFSLPPTRCFNVWRKLTISEGFTMAMCEYAWCSFNRNAKWWEFAPQDPERFHPTQKPLALIARQIEEYTEPGALILDPFSGSGTTAVAAHMLGRRFICIEKDEDYWRASVERLDKVRAQGLLGI